MKRQQIVNAIKTRLQGIKIVNGYQTNIGNNVFEWKTTAVEHGATAVIFRDVANIKHPINVLNFFRWELAIEIEIVTTAAAIEVRKMIADVYKAIGTDITWGGLAINTYQPDDRMQIVKEEKIIAGVLIEMTILYQTSEWEA